MTSTPPAGYRLADASIRIERQFGHGLPASRLDLAGQGDATLRRGDKQTNFTPTDAQRIGWIQGLYRARFFELPTDWRAPASVFLKDDGTVALQQSLKLDSGSTAVCFKLPAFEQCVRYTGQGPRELDDWVQALLGEAGRRTSAGAK